MSHKLHLCILVYFQKIKLVCMFVLEHVPLNLHGVTPQAKVLSSTSSSAEQIHSVTQLRSGL